MALPALAIGGLCVTLHRDGRPLRVLDGIDLEMEPGEVVALVGESGAGKSTVGLALQGLLPPDSRPVVAGSARIAGVEIIGASQGELRTARRSLLRLVPQDPMAALNPTMTIGRQLAESGGDTAFALSLLARMGIADPGRVAGAYPHRLSGGQRQRVLIAMAMLARPQLVVADEPTTALDVTTQAQILELLRELAREQQTATLLITHDLGVAAAIADRIVVLHDGRIVEAGPARSLIHAPQQPYTRRMIATRFDLGSDRTRPLPVDLTTPANWPMKPRLGEASALRLTGVGKSYPTGAQAIWDQRRQRPALRSIDLSVRLGECVALVGESGAGKSTILRIAAGLVTPDSGEVSCAEPPQLVSQDPASALTPWLSIGEQIGERLRSSGLKAAERESRVRDAMGLVGLDPALASMLPGELSLGQCQRAVLARAIVVPPQLLLCDEPVSAVDVPLAAAILNLLGDLRRRLGMALLFVTHDLAAARLVADRIAVLRHGELVEQGDAEALIRSPVTAYTRSLIDAVPSLEWAR